MAESHTKVTALQFADQTFFLRTAERVLIQIGRVKATSYDQLFEEVKKLNWSDFIPADGKFWVKKASTVKEQNFLALQTYREL